MGWVSYSEDINEMIDQLQQIVGSNITKNEHLFLLENIKRLLPKFIKDIESALQYATSPDVPSADLTQSLQVKDGKILELEDQIRLLNSRLSERSKTIDVLRRINFNLENEKLKKKESLENDSRDFFNAVNGIDKMSNKSILNKKFS